jgi:hypothetical protein
MPFAFRKWFGTMTKDAGRKTTHHDTMYVT